MNRNNKVSNKLGKSVIAALLLLTTASGSMTHSAFANNEDQMMTKKQTRNIETRDAVLTSPYFKHVTPDGVVILDEGETLDYSVDLSDIDSLDITTTFEVNHVPYTVEDLDFELMYDITSNNYYDVSFKIPIKEGTGTVEFDANVNTIVMKRVHKDPVTGEETELDDINIILTLELAEKDYKYNEVKASMTTPSVITDFNLFTSALDFEFEINTMDFNATKFNLEGVDFNAADITWVETEIGLGTEPGIVNAKGTLQVPVSGVNVNYLKTSATYDGNKVDITQEGIYDKTAVTGNILTTDLANEATYYGYKELEFELTDQALDKNSIEVKVTHETGIETINLKSSNPDYQLVDVTQVGAQGANGENVTHKFKLLISDKGKSFTGLDISANDLTGNASHKVELTEVLKFDIVAPTLEANYNEAYTYYHSKPIDLHILLETEDFDISQLTSETEGITFVSVEDLGNKKYKVNYKINQRGEYTPAFTLKDKFGNVIDNATMQPVKYLAAVGITLDNDITTNWSNKVNLEQVYTIDGEIDLDSVKVFGKDGQIVTDAEVKVINTEQTQVTVVYKEDGLMKPKITVNDKSGKEYSFEGGQFTLDTVAPEIKYELTSVANNLTEDRFSNTLVEYTVTVRDANLTPGQAVVTDGGVIGAWEDLTANGGVPTYRFTLKVSDEGTYKPTVKITDKATNETTIEIPEFTIDATAPEVKVELETELHNTLYTAEDMIVKVTIKDKYFDKDNFYVTDLEDLGSIQKDITWVDGETAEEHIAKVTVKKDGSHKLKVSAVDKARNKTEVDTEKFIIDKFVPTVEVKNNGTFINDKYINKTNTYTVTVTTPYFNEKSIIIADGTLSDWKHEGNKHTATLTVTGDGVHTPTFDVKNLANVEAKGWVGQEFIIDTIAPVIKLNGVDQMINGKYVARIQNITVTVTDNNINLNDIIVKGGNLIGTWTTEGNVHTNTITTTGNGIVQVFVNGKDLAGNNATEVKTSEFIVDTTLPVLDVTNNTDIKNGKYTNGNIVHSITVTDTNFNTANGLAYDNGSLNGWTSNGARYSTVNTITTEGVHNLTVSATDLAGHKSNVFNSGELIIDRTAPSLEFRNVTNGQVFMNDFRPTVIYSDTNIDENATSVTITGPNDVAVSLAGGAGEYYLSDLPVEKEYDGYYTIEANIVDLAGNTTTETMRFGINRFGSDFDGNAFEYNRKYLQELKEDLEITEVSLVKIEKLQLRMYRDGVLVPEADVKLKVKEAEANGYYTYTYTLDKEQFSEGVYEIIIESLDESGNVSKALSEITFVIDRTAPEVLYNVTESTVYNEPNKLVTMNIHDLHGVEEVEIKLNGKVQDIEPKGAEYQLDIEGSNELQTIEVTAKDKAGNELESEVNFYVTTNVWLNVRHSDYFIPGVSGVGAVGVGSLFFLLFKRRKKDEEEMTAEDFETGEVPTAKM